MDLTLAYTLVLTSDLSHIGPVILSYTVNQILDPSKTRTGAQTSTEVEIA